MRPSAAAAAATARLAAAGVGSPRVDAELLLAEVLGISRGALIAAAPLTAPQSAAYEQLIGRREAREPLQHIVGHAPFGPLELAVGPGVFVPRPETELLAAWAAAAAQPGAGIVDLCAGSGALGLYLAATVPAARVVLVEKSAAALKYLRRNAAGSAATVLGLDVTDETLPEAIATAVGDVDLVVCNPPYVPRGTRLDREAAADPEVALFSGADGLDLIRRIAPLSAQLLRGGGAVGIEHDDANGDGAAALLESAGFSTIAHRDLADRPRFVTGRMEP